MLVPTCVLQITTVFVTVMTTYHFNPRMVIYVNFTHTSAHHDSSIDPITKKTRVSVEL